MVASPSRSRATGEGKIDRLRVCANDSQSFFDSRTGRRSGAT
jgi:hypothetical protein